MGGVGYGAGGDAGDAGDGGHFSATVRSAQT